MAGKNIKGQCKASITTKHLTKFCIENIGHSGRHVMTASFDDQEELDLMRDKVGSDAELSEKWAMEIV